ncbi:MAG: DUF302 domain-containing protein [Reyranella sp.]|uniref:DUF302 domain-containing protein n=1 Tax=Reyranella sp. TaxID=1929291 RepID=UPI003D0A186B
MPNCLAQFCSAALIAFALAVGSPVAPAHAEGAKPAVASAAGVIAVPSGYGMIETVERLKKDIATKGIQFFGEVDQGALAAVSGVPGVKPSVLLMFGNPPLGTQFVGGRQQSGLDWPVRMLVYLEAPGQVMIAWTDFDWIARRHGLTGLDAQLKMANEVAASIASAAARK